MTPLRAKDALSDAVVCVPAESRLADILELLRTRQAGYCAVFDQEAFCGLVKLRDILFLSPQRIFVDLVLRESQPPGVLDEATVEEVIQQMEKWAADALPVFDGQGGFVGCVTHESLIEALLEHKQTLLEQTERMKAVVEADRICLGERTERLEQLHLASKDLLSLLASSPIEGALLQKGIEALARLVEARYGAVTILDEHGQLAQFAHTGLTAEEAKRIGGWPQGHGLLGAIIQENQAMRLDDLTKDPHHWGFPPCHPKMKTLLGVPIASRGRSYGQVYLTEKIHDQPFTAEDESLAATFANSLALAIENTRLFEETVEQRDSLTEKMRQLEALNKAGRVISGELALDELLKKLAEVAGQLVGARYSAVGVYDELGKLEIFVPVGMSEEEIQAVGDYPEGRGLLGAILASREPLRLDDLMADPRSVGFPPHHPAMYRFLGVPIISRGRVLGSFYMANPESEAPFTAEHERVLVNFAASAAVAIENARLYGRERAARRRAEVLADIIQAASSTLDLKTVLMTLVRKIVEVLRVKRCTIYLPDERLGRIADFVNFGVPEDRLPLLEALKGRKLVEFPIARRLLEASEPILIPDASQSKLLPRELTHALGMKATVCAPVRFGNRPIAALFLDVSDARAFTSEDLTLVQSVANQAAVAVEKARLHQETERRLREVEGLYEITQRFSAMRDSRKVYGQLAELIAKLVGATKCIVASYDHKTKEIRARSPGYNVSQEMVAAARYFVSGEVKAHWDLHQRGPFIAHGMADIPVELRWFARQFGIENLLAVAMVVEAKVVGVIYLANKPGGFTDEDARLVTIFAGQAARVIENARLYEQLTASEIKYRQIFQGAIEGIYQTTPEGKLLTANPAMARILGYDSVDELLGENAFEFYVAPEDREQWRRRLEREGALIDVEIQHRRRDGRLIWVRDSARAVRDASGQVLYYEGAVVDVTERKQAEEALRQYAERLKILHKIDQAVLAAQSPEAIAQVALEHLQQLVPCTRASVATFDLSERQATLLAAIGNGAARTEMGMCISPEVLGLAEELRRGKVRTIEDIRILPALSPMDQSLFEEGVCSYINVPLVVHGKLIGCLNLGFDCPGAFAPKQVEIAREVGDALAIAIQHARLFEQVQAGRERLQTLSRRLIKAQEAERRRIARELHDEIGQVLTAVKISLEAVERLPDASPLVPRLRESTRIVERALQQVRSLSFHLRPSLLDDLGLVAALRWYVDQQAQQAGFTVQFTAESVQPRLLPDLEIACFRITQEALSNVARHARAERVQVQLRQRGAELELVIRDDGVGFDLQTALARAADGASLGVLGMQERALLAGGRLEIETAPMAGTTVRAWFPLSGAGRVRREA